MATVTVTKEQVDREFNTLKFQVMSIIEAALPDPRQQSSVRNLVRTELERTRVQILNWLGVDEDYETMGRRMRRFPRPDENPKEE